VAAVEAPAGVVKVVDPILEPVATVETPQLEAPAVVRKKWAPKAGAASVAEAAQPVASSAPVVEAESGAPVVAETAGPSPARKKWEPKKGVKPPEGEV
jgi:hypothetical protein